MRPRKWFGVGDPTQKIKRKKIRKVRRNVMEKTCPLGKKCESCLWSLEFETTPPTGGRVKVSRCAVEWLPLLQVELLTMMRTAGPQK